MTSMRHHARSCLRTAQCDDVQHFQKLCQMGGLTDSSLSHSYKSLPSYYLRHPYDVEHVILAALAAQAWVEDIISCKWVQ